MTPVSMGLIAAWAAIGIVLAYQLTLAWRRVMLDDTPLPFFSVLERRHLTPQQIEESGGVHRLGTAVRRCALCGARAGCSRSLAQGRNPVTAPGCPNAGFFEASGF
ncbi:MAG TPA: hypothetical protein VFZ74_09750 [Burkholderiales bacterium]